MPSTPVVKLQETTKTYNKDLVALKSINLTIDKNELIGIIGANGSGKSTLLKVIAGDLIADQGKVRVFQLNPQKKANQLKKLIGYISQDRALDSEMTGQELLHYFSALYGLSGQLAKLRYNELVNQFELADFINRRVKTYSGGQAQRLHLAIGILHQPKLLLLDEPTGALDPTGKGFFWSFIQSYHQQGHSIIIISHELDNIQQNCSRVLLLDKGKLIANKTPDAIIHTYAKPILYIKSTSNLANKESLLARLEQSIPSSNITFKGQSAHIEINQQSDLNKSDVLTLALQAFQNQQQPIVECRWEEPSLENAYFKLTGQKIMAPYSMTKKNKKGQRKAH